MTSAADWRKCHQTYTNKREQPAPSITNDLDRKDRKAA